MQAELHDEDRERGIDMSTVRIEARHEILELDRAKELWGRIARDGRFKSHVREVLLEKGKGGRSIGRKIADELVKAGADFAVVARTYKLLNEIQRGDTMRAIDRADAWGNLVEVFSRGTAIQRAKVGPNGALDLYFVAQRGDELTIECINGIAASSKSTREREGQDIASFIKIMATYDGSPEKLRNFVSCVGEGRAVDKTKNPFLAAQEVQILPGAEVPTEGLNALTLSGEGVERPYRAIHPSNPSMMFVSGAQAILKILATFNPEHYSRESLVKKRRERKEVNNEFLSSVEFRDLFDENKVKGIRQASKLIARHLDVFHELQQHIENLRGQVYGGGIVAESVAGAAFSRIKSYAGGTMWSYFEENEEKLPTNVAEGYKLLCDPLVHLSRDEESVLRQGLLSYFLGNVATIKKSTLQDIQSDLNDYVDTQKKNPGWFAANNLPSIDTANRIADIRHLTDDVRDELTIREVAQVYESLSFLVAFRERKNAEVAELYKDEIVRVKALARNFFMNPIDRVGIEEAYEWRADSLTDSVPMARLEAERVEVAKIFSRYGDTRSGSDRLYGALGRDDLSAMQKLLQLGILGAQDAQHLRSYSVSYFREMVLRSVASARKCEALYAELGSRGITSRSPENAVQQLGKSIGEVRVFPPGSYALAERLSERHGMPVDEILSRLRWRSTSGRSGQSTASYMNAYRAAAPVLEAALKARIFPEKLDFLDKAIAEVATFTPATVLAEEVRALQFLKNVDRNPSFPGAKFTGWTAWEASAYFSNTQVDVLRRALVTEKELLASYTPDFVARINQVKAYEGKRLIHIEHGYLSNDAVTPFGNKFSNGSRRCNVLEEVSLGGGLEFSRVSSTKLNEALTYLTTGVVLRGAVPEEFFTKFRLAQRGERGCSLQNVGVTTVGVSPTVDAMRAGQNLLIDRGLFDRVMSISPKMPSKPADGDMIVRKVVLRNGEPVITFGQANGGLLGKSMLDLSVDTLRWIEQSRLSPDVRDLAYTITQMKQSSLNQTELRHKFWEWLQQ